MNIESSILLLIMILVGAIPIVIINKKRKVKEKQFLQTLISLAEKSNSIITEQDKWGDRIIGIDKMTHKMFFIKKTAENESGIEIDLDEMKKCRFINTHSVVTFKESSQKVTERLELAFAYNDPQKPDLILEFYNSAYDSLTLRDEINLAEKWSAIANYEISRERRSNIGMK